MSRISDLILSAQEAKDAEEALDALTAYEGSRFVCFQSTPALTPEQQAARDAYVKFHKCPF